MTGSEYGQDSSGEPPRSPEVFVSGEGTQIARASDLPKYVSHKVVHAAKIRRWETVPAEGQRPAELVLFLEGFESPLMSVDPKLFARYVPVPGDYFVVYADGYQSISPAKAFEEGYTLAENIDA